MIVLSKSGATRELDGPPGPSPRAHEVPVVALAGRPDSPLARRAAAVLDCGVSRRGVSTRPGAHHLHHRRPRDGRRSRRRPAQAAGLRFGRLRAHPPRRLAGPPPEIARAPRDGVPTTTPRSPPTRTVRERSSRHWPGCAGPCRSVDGGRSVVGVVTAGDLTRFMERTGDFLDAPVSDFMTRTPKTASPEEPGAAAVHRMEEHGIMALPVVDERRPGRHRAPARPPAGGSGLMVTRKEPSPPRVASGVAWSARLAALAALAVSGVPERYRRHGGHGVRGGIVRRRCHVWRVAQHVRRTASGRRGWKRTAC